MDKFEETKKLLDKSNTYYLIAVGMDSNFTYVNKRYQRVFENTHHNLVGQHYSITMHPEDLDICRSVSELAFKNPGAVFPATIRKHDGKGGYVITQWEYKAIFDANYQPAGMFCMGHDITAFMQNSLELKDTKATLDQAKLTLAQINYIQSHGVRKPIANIMGLSQILESMDLEPGLRNVIHMMNESAKELDQVIRNMAAGV